MSEIKAIETVYNGYRFRSRLEARWAVFFDALGIRYLYEPQGYVLKDGTCYFPDFYLPDMNEFFEVKGKLKLTDEKKVNQFIAEAKIPVVIGFDEFTFSACDEFDEGYFQTDKSTSMLMKCNRCNNYYFAGVYGFWNCKCCGFYDGEDTSKWCISGNHSDYYAYNNSEKEKVLNAIKKAKQARFEHGERG